MSREPERDRQQELFEATQRLASVGGWEYDLRTGRLYWTDEACRIHGYAVGYEPTITEAIECYHPADQPQVRATIEAAVDRGESFEHEWRLRTADDEWRWVCVRGKPHREDGSTVRIQGAITDITDRKQHQTRLNSLFETSRGLLAASTAEETATIAVEAAHDILGLSINGVYLYDEDRDALVSTATTEEATDIIEEIPTFEAGGSVTWSVFESGEPREYDDVRTAPEVYNAETVIRSELVLPLGDHGVFLAGSTAPNAFDDRTVSLAKLLAADIETALDQLAHETALRETSERLETIIQYTPDALFVLDDDERIVEANEQACTSLGYDCDSDDESVDCARLLGSHWSEIGTVIEGDTPVADADPLESLREHPESVITVEGRHTRRDGSTYPVRIRVARIDHDGEGGFLAIARNISEITAQQRQLRRQNEQLDQFASVISHDLRSPLSVARAGVEVARRTGEGHGDSLERVGRAHDRMETLIENLLGLARNGQSMDRTDLEPVDLSAVVTHSWETVSTDGAELRIEDDLTLVADESRLRQLVENLFRNAVDHGATSSQPQADEHLDHAADLTVRVGTLPGGFYIEDDGTGIPAASQEKVFEPGYTTHDEGTGYGLEIVRTVATAHDWEITVTDSTDGGARFEITGVDGSGPN